MGIILGISIAINVLVGLGVFLLIKFRKKITNKLFQPIDFNSFINDDDNFLDRM